MIKRIFRVTIDPEQRVNFEKDFNSISVEAVKNKEGFISVEIGGPTKWNSNDYVMVSHWANEASLEGFAGKNWNQAVIPGPMAKYVISCSVEHYSLK